jgi:hypothetical protein
MNLNILYITLPQAFHEIAGTLFIFWCQKKVHMSCHNGIRMNGTTRSEGIFLQPVQIKTVLNTRNTRNDTKA